MTNHPHPFGYTKEMRQAFLTGAFGVALIAALLTPALFATPSFANSYFGFTNKVGADLTPTVYNLSKNYHSAQVSGATLPQSTNGTFQAPQPKPPMPPTGTMGQNMMGKPQMQGQLSPAEIVRILVNAGLIAQEKAQEAIEVLKKAMANNTDKNQRACANFTRVLRAGDRGEDVRRLNELLKEEGFTVPGEGTEFTEETSSAVTGLQEKYRNEILTPAGLKYGTGLMGKGTMGKLNRVYGCGDTGQGTQPGPGSSNTANQPMAEMLQKKMEMQELYLKMCKELGQCPPMLQGTVIPGATGTTPPPTTVTQ